MADRAGGAEICDGSGRQLDPAVVDAFRALDHHALVTPIATHAQLRPSAAPTPVM